MFLRGEKSEGLVVCVRGTEGGQRRIETMVDSHERRRGGQDREVLERGGRASNGILSPNRPSDAQQAECLIANKKSINALEYNVRLQARIDFNAALLHEKSPVVVRWDSWVEAGQLSSLAFLLADSPVFRDDRRVPLPGDGFSTNRVRHGRKIAHRDPQPIPVDRLLRIENY